MKKLLLALCFLLPVQPAFGGGVPVIDAAQLQAKMMSYIEDIAQTLNQAESIALQFQQYERQLKDAMAPAFYIWEEADQTMDSIYAVMEPINNYRNLAFEAQSYIDELEGGLSWDKLNNIYNRSNMLLNRQKQASDSMIRVLQRQQRQLDFGVDQLRELQVQTEVAGEGGQMEAIQTANMIALEQTKQLRLINELLVSSQNQITAHLVYEQEQEKMKRAASKSFIGEKILLESKGFRWEEKDFGQRRK